MNSNISKNKRKTNYLSLNAKVGIIRKYEDGNSYRQLAKEHNVSVGTIHNIIKHGNNIMALNTSLHEKDPKRKFKRLSAVEDPILCDIVHAWFERKRAAGIYVSGPKLKEKALEVNKTLVGQPNFKASNGWLYRFKKRYGISELSIQGDQLSADVETSQLFCEQFRHYIQTESFEEDHIYNADETDLQWKSLPKNLASYDEKEAPEFKMEKERVSLLVCSNASGTHKIPLLLVGKSENPRCFRDYHNLPVHYTSQSNACIDTHVFRNWFVNVFLSEIKTKMKSPDEKFLLVLDNAPSHSDLEFLNEIDSCCSVMFLPKNRTSGIQPMEQGPIDVMKTFYKKAYLQEFILHHDNEDDTYANFHKSWTLLRCVENISAAWERITNATLCRAWSKLLGKRVSCDNLDDIEEIAALASPAMKRQISVTEINEWLLFDHNDSDTEDISARKMNNKNRSEDMNEKEDDDNLGPPPPTTEQALQGSTDFFNWLMTRSEVDKQDLATVAKYKNLITAILVKEKFLNDQ